MNCPQCGAPLRLTLDLSSGWQGGQPQQPPAITGSNGDAKAQMRVIHRELDRYLFWSILRSDKRLGERVTPRIGPDATPETILAMDPRDFGDYFGPYRCTLMIRALLKAGVSADQILDSRLWQDARGNRGHLWRHNAQFKQLTRELEGES